MRRMIIKYRSIMLSGVAVAFVWGLLSTAVWSEGGDQATVNVPPVPAEELPQGSEVLTSGPVHEAFAKPVTIQHEAGVEAPQPPPANIPETPPLEKPVGASIVWVPGYWAWDAPRNDYIWVSGCWRSAPPNMHWVPGYWRETAGGYEWVAGFWTPHAETNQQIEYLPAPPAPVEIESPGQPSGPDQFWTPGCWYWMQGRWTLRHGYWHTSVADWVWVPSHYAWTPHGYVFCPGYWDHALEHRGVLFAPVYFPAVVRSRLDFVFAPSLCVDLGVFRLNLFTYPRYHHYYFGDFYDDACVRLGIYPWFDCQTVHTWYDPIFVYDYWHVGRADPHWLDNQRHHYETLRTDINLRPTKTYAELQTRISRQPVAERAAAHMVMPLKSYAAQHSTSLTFERITPAARQQIAVKTTAANQFREQRAHWEAPTPRPVETGHHPIATNPTHEAIPPATEHSSRSKEVTRPSPVSPAETERHPVVTKPVHAATPPVTEHPSRSKEVTRPAFVPPHEVHITQPERVKIPSPPIAARPSESHYIQKEAPVRPAQERSHLTPSPNQTHDVPGRDGQKNQH